MLTHEQEVARAHLAVAIIEELEKDPSFAYVVIEIVARGLDQYRQKVTRKNSNIDLIVRNLKPEYYAELQKYIVPEVFESLGLQDAIRVIEEQK